VRALIDIQESLDTPRVTGPEHRPRSIGDTGVRESTLEDLALKSLYLCGPFSVLDLSQQTRLGYDVADQLFNRMRSKLLCEVAGMNHNVPTIAITSHGRARALELLSQNQYAGPAPVSLESYVEQVKRQSVKHVEVHPADVERAFSHLVIEDKTLSQFGTALNSGTAVFIYGPSGVGKTAAAETLSRVLAEDAVWIPYSIEVDGQIITVYDPSIHKHRANLEPGDHDRRWVMCDRPAVMVGGELTAEMLDLQFNPVCRYYFGPVQMKANNGVLIVDDFGRQRIAPEELLNRWVVPLDRRIEFLSLVGGRKIEIPFEMLVVFASNLDPAEVMDQAFLRRIQTKIHIAGASPRQFREIFRRVAAVHGLAIEEQILDELVIVIRDSLRQELRPCYPRDLVNQVLWAAKYEGRQPTLDRASILRAVESYFLPKL
jgi:energy-coupling factor transporter ATP-binding protein EcfA2